jgi:hypothetical protein
VQTLINFLKEALAWLFSFFDWLIQEVVQLVLAGLAAVLALIPVPSWLMGAAGVMGAMPPGVAFVANAFMLPQGLAIIISAYTIRFVIRRIPFIG